MPGKLQKRLNQRVRALAAAREIPLTHLADRADVARTHFWAVLRGTKSPTLQWVEKIAEPLGVDPGELLAPDAKGR